MRERIPLANNETTLRAARHLINTSALWGLVEVTGETAKSAYLHHPAPHTEPELAALWEVLASISGTGKAVDLFSLHDRLSEVSQAAVVGALAVSFGHVAEVRAA